MNALDKALEESIRKQRERRNSPQPVAQPTGESLVASAQRTTKHVGGIDPFSPEARLLRAESEDDDGYDPYSDYMDQLARSNSYEDELEEDPWR